jgi:hypothetical protein
MPIEIRELVVRARIDTEEGCPPGPESARSGRAEGGGGGETREQEIVQVCVREVLRILEDRRER